MLATGCTKRVFVPEIHVEHRDRVQKDSVFIRDSVVIRMTSDTVFVYRDRWRERLYTRRDTLFVRDSITCRVTVEKKVRHIPQIYRWSLWIAILAVGWGAWKVMRRML